MQNMKLTYREVYDQLSHARVAGRTSCQSVLFAEARFRGLDWQSDPGGKQRTAEHHCLTQEPLAAATCHVTCHTPWRARGKATVHEHGGGVHTIMGARVGCEFMPSLRLWKTGQPIIHIFVQQLTSASWECHSPH